MKAFLAIGFSLFGVALSGCSQKQMSGEELRSQVERAQKLARECVTLLDLEEHRQLTKSFYKTQSDYVSKKAEELQREIGEKQPSDEISAAYGEYRQQLDELAAQTKNLGSSPERQHFQQLDGRFRALESKF